MYLKPRYNPCFDWKRNPEGGLSPKREDEKTGSRDIHIYIYIDTDTIVFISLCITLRSRARHGGAFGASVYGGFLHRHLVENGRRTLVHKSGMGDPWVIIDGHSFRCHCICYMCEILALHTNTSIYIMYSTNISWYHIMCYKHIYVNMEI